MKVTILGGAGELGSHVAQLCVNRGHKVSIIDVVRFNEAWRLEELSIQDEVEYNWKSVLDLAREDVKDTDLILDTACFADRPLGTSSPKHTLINNLLGPLTLLEIMKRHGNKNPSVIYPSSCVEFLGLTKDLQPVSEGTKPKPTNLYGWSKWATEELYLTYGRSYQIPCTVVRTGSCYGPRMRTDQLIAKAIISCLKGRTITVKSPYASRTYTYTGDVMEFYSRFFDKFEEEPRMFDSLVIHNGGNAENQSYTTIDAVRTIAELTSSTSSIYEGEYEIGELINGEPVYQHETSKLAYELLGWKPRYTFRDGLRETISWFKENLHRFI